MILKYLRLTFVSLEIGQSCAKVDKRMPPTPSPEILCMRQSVKVAGKTSSNRPSGFYHNKHSLRLLVRLILKKS